MISSNRTALILYGSIAFGFLLFQAITLSSFGQPFFCECGVIKLWEGVVFSAGNSQQLTDWYTFSHIIHGILFYGLFSLLFPRSSLGIRLLLAMTLEIAWEIAENTPMVINAYRAQALAVGYNGDSIFNSVSDTLSMATGFFLAHRLPFIMSIILVLSLELFAGYFIHDNLALNILNFIHPFEAITAWQSSLY